MAGRSSDQWASYTTRRTVKYQSLVVMDNLHVIALFCRTICLHEAKQLIIFTK